jgi:threonylcarbamoyladenosine tRNA methylthiotransferase MtaB
VNQYESQYVKETLEANGYHEAEPGEAADLCVVNTCTVTREGDAKSRQAVRRLHKKNPGAAIVVMGCYATRDPETVRRLPGVTRIITDKQQLGEGLREFGVVRLPAGVRRFDGHQRAFVKVQDGCLLNCTYCIIPSVRPVLRSRPAEEIVEEVAGLAAAGYQEIVLTGVHLGHYGIDLSKGQPKAQWQRLWHLVRGLGEVPGDFRIRLSSLEAAEVRDGLVRAIAETPRVVPHLHLCLQSGSDRILARMRRRYRTAGFLARCDQLRRALDQPAFTTDVIIGFPGETDEDFAATCSLVRTVGFCKIHIFSYSPRAGTPAAGYPETVPPQVVAERRERLLEIEKELIADYQGQLVGRRLDVLVEGAAPGRPGWVIGTSCRQVPVVLPGHLPALQARVVPVHVEGVEEGVIVGRPETEVTALAVSAGPLVAGGRVALPLI